MDKNLDEPGKREYLLGVPEDPDIMRQIEEKLMTDDEFDLQMAIAEDELIEQYLDDELSDAEREQFAVHFLASPERKEKLRLVRNLRRYAAAQEQAEAEAEAETPPDKTPAPGWWFFTRPVFSYALIFVVVMGLGYGVWRIAFDRSNDVDLRLVYKGDRPLKSRIVGFEYAPVVETRGPGDKKAAGLEIERATKMLEKAVADKRTAESLYGRGKAYLAERNFQAAISAFEEAGRLGPANANLMSDLGAAYLEASGNERNGDKAGLLDKSLRSLDRAIELDPKLPEPRFNRALCLEAMGSKEQAKQAWREYVDLDPNSKWTEEAGRNLRRLEEEQ